MASQNPNPKPLYPKIDPSNPNPNPNPSSSSLYPSVDLSDLVNDLFPDDYHHPYPNPNPNPNPNQNPNPNPNPNQNPNPNPNPNSGTEPPSAPLHPEPIQETLLTVPGAVVHLIDQHCSVELSVGDFSVVRIRDGDNLVAVLLRVSDEVQWPLMKDEVVVKLDHSHYFFSFPDSTEDGAAAAGGGGGGGEVLNYGLSFATKGQEDTLSVLDEIFRTYGNFTEQRVSERSRDDVAGVGLTEELTPVEVKTDKKKREMMERNSGAYWTTLAPNVEEYSGTAAKLIASGSGKLIQGILWCGDITSDRLHWGHEVLKKRLDPCLDNKEIDPSTLKRIKRVKRTTKMTNKVAEGVLSGVVRVSGFFTSSVVNSKAGKKFFSLLPGEVILASLDGFNRICDAVEVAGKNVMSTSSTVTTGLVTHKYGEEAGKATNEGLGAAGHAIGTAWTVFKIRKALNPKSSVKPTSLAKSALKAAATDYKSQKSTKK